MSYNEFPLGSPNTGPVIESITREHIYNDVSYNNIGLSCSSEGIVASTDPNAEFRPEYAAVYWPGGNPETAHTFEGFSIFAEELPPTEHADRTTRMRKVILGSEVNKLVFNQISPEMKDVWQRFARRVTLPPILSIETACAIKGTPLAVCTLGKFTQDSTLPPDAKAAYLWYPTPISPKPVLIRLKQQVREIIKNETL